MSNIITRSRQIEFAVLDIAAQPHPSGVYVKLFKLARGLRRAIKIQGQEFAEISELSFHKNDTGKIDQISGDIYRFTKIDEKADWFDTSTGEPATDELKGQVSIPSNLRPNTRVIHWVFIVKSHMLVFLHKNGDATLSALQAQRFFESLMKMAAAKHDHVNYVDVTVVKSAEAIDRIFKSQKVTNLEIEIRRPNPDDPSSVLIDIEKTMREEGARKWVEILTAEDGESIIKSDRIDNMLNASQVCGKAKAITYNEEGDKDIVDTNDHPMIEREIYDPKSKVPFLTFVAFTAIAIVSTIMASKRK